MTSEMTIGERPRVTSLVGCFRSAEPSSGGESGKMPEKLQRARASRESCVRPVGGADIVSGSTPEGEVRRGNGYGNPELDVGKDACDETALSVGVLDVMDVFFCLKTASLARVSAARYVEVLRSSKMRWNSG